MIVVYLKSSHRRGEQFFDKNILWNASWCT